MIVVVNICMVGITVVILVAMVVLMAVMPQLGFVEQKEKQQAKQERDEEVVRLDTCLKSFW